MTAPAITPVEARPRLPWLFALASAAFLGLWLTSAATALAAPPTISNVSPDEGPAGGGTTVTITGSNFVEGETIVTFDGIEATEVEVTSETTLTAVTPPHAPGAVHVIVIADGSVTAQNAFTYQGPAPTITGIAPNEGLGTGGTSVTITGTNFVSGVDVTIGGKSATNVVRVSSTTLTARTPSRASSGNVDVVVTNPDGRSATLAGGFTYTAAASPTITTISPNNGPTTGGTPVTIIGTNFASGATVAFGSNAATDVVVVSSTTITAKTPARSTTGKVNVVVTNADGKSATLASAFEYRTPTISVTSISPNSGPIAGGTAVTIKGTGFKTGTTVRFGTTSATSIVIVNDTTITAVTPAHAAGKVDVNVTVPGTSVKSLDDAFTYLGAKPTITSVTPASGPTSGGTDLVIRGTNFAAGLTVTLAGTNATNVTRVSDTEARVRTPARAQEGGVQLLLKNVDGQTAESVFVYVRPLGSIVSGSINTSGLALIVFSGGSSQQLIDAAAAGGCSSSRQAFYTISNGRWITLIPAAPAQVNTAWNTLFANGLPTNIPLAVRCL